MNEFDLEYNKCNGTGIISNQIGVYFYGIIDVIMYGYKIRDIDGDVTNILKSDVMLECIEVMRKNINKKYVIDNPYRYYHKLIFSKINRLLKERFSGRATKDHLGCSLYTGLYKHGEPAKFINIYDLTDYI